MQLQDDYLTAYRSLKLTRDSEGVLVAEFHSNNGPLTFTEQDHTQFVGAYYRIAPARPALRGRLTAKASASQSLIASILAALALILRAFRARTLSIVRKLWTTFAEAKSLALLTMASRLRCRASETASARWSSA